MRQEEDRCGKWLIGHYGDAILKLGGHRNIRTWRAVQAVTVAPSRLPDGLIEVFFGESTQANLFLSISKRTRAAMRTARYSKTSC